MRETDWTVYLRVYRESCNARRNHNIREDLLQKDIVKRFALEIRLDQGKASHARIAELEATIAAMVKERQGEACAGCGKTNDLELYCHSCYMET
jgi:hypothetical protein